PRRASVVTKAGAAPLNAPGTGSRSRTTRAGWAPPVVRRPHERIGAERPERAAGPGGTYIRRRHMRRFSGVVLALALVMSAVGTAAAQAPIEAELTLITPVSKFIHDAALKAFADYAKERWNVVVKVNAIPAGTPIAYGRITEWKGKPEADIFWGGESALFEKLAEQKLLQKLEISREAWDSMPASIGKPKPIPLKDPEGYWVGTALEPYGLVWHPRKLQRLGVPELRDWDDLLNPKLKG